MAVLYGKGQDGNIYPLKITKNPDGTATLAVDTEITLSGDVIVERVRISYGNPKHYNGNANIISAIVSFNGPAKHIQVEDMDDKDNLYVSFNGGTNWRTIRPGEILDINCDGVTSLDIKAEADTTPYEILTTE